jgi:hypothetical protein
MTTLQQRHLMGLCFVGMAALLAFHANTLHGRSANQDWLPMVVAAIFALAGLQLVTAIKGRLSALMGGLVCGGLSSLGFYVTFSHEQLEGGVPFFPTAWNQAIGHTMFGFGALITAAMAIYFLVRAIKPGEKK